MLGKVESIWFIYASEPRLLCIKKVRAYQNYYFKDIQHRLSASQVRQQKHFDIRFKCQQQQVSDFKFLCMIYKEQQIG